MFQHWSQLCTGSSRDATVHRSRRSEYQGIYHLLPQCWWVSLHTWSTLSLPPGGYYMCLIRIKRISGIIPLVMSIWLAKFVQGPTCRQGASLYEKYILGVKNLDSGYYPFEVIKMSCIVMSQMFAVNKDVWSQWAWMYQSALSFFIVAFRWHGVLWKSSHALIELDTLAALSPPYYFSS